MNRFSQIKLAQGNIILQKLIQAVGKKPDQMHPKKGGQVELVWLVPYKLEDQGWSLSVTLTTNRILVDLYLDVNYDSSDGGEVDFNDLYGHLARFNMKQIDQAATFLAEKYQEYSQEPLPTPDELLAYYERKNEEGPSDPPEEDTKNHHAPPSKDILEGRIKFWVDKLKKETPNIPFDTLYDAVKFEVNKEGVLTDSNKHLFNRVLEELADKLNL